MTGGGPSAAAAEAVEGSRSHDETLEAWVRVLGLRDGEAEGHSRRVVGLTVRLAEELGIEGEPLLQIRRGALLHDIGKLALPDAILRKAGALNAVEREVMRRHPIYAWEMLSEVDFLRPALDIPYCHHERWDGSGYPRGLRGEKIPFSARLAAVVDVWDALRNDRSYRGWWPEETVRNHLREGSGTQFDPAVVPVFLRMLERDERQASPCTSNGR